MILMWFFFFFQLQVSSSLPEMGPGRLAAVTKIKIHFLWPNVMRTKWWMFHSSLRPVWALLGHRQQACEGRCESCGESYEQPHDALCTGMAFLLVFFIGYIVILYVYCY